MPRALGRLAALAALGAAAACALGPPTVPTERFVVTLNPYAGIDWATTLRLKVQLHDHVGTDTVGLLAYDLAGYDAMSLMHYSGAPSLVFAWTERRWPAEHWLPPGFVGRLARIRQFVPNAEEVGAAHVISPFLTVFVSHSVGAGGVAPERLYLTTQDCIDVIRANGGLAFLAHPWTHIGSLLALRDFDGIEIYSAFARYHDLVGGESAPVPGGRQRLLLDNWDALLARNPAVRGIAVNDHYGPGSRVADLPGTIRDSGKIMVFVPERTDQALQSSLGAGRFVAVADLGAVKDRFPTLDSVLVDPDAVTIATADSVSWVASGRLVGQGPRLSLVRLPAGIRYVRAELRNGEGSVVYTQAFGLGPA